MGNPTPSTIAPQGTAPTTRSGPAAAGALFAWLGLVGVGLVCLRLALGDASGSPRDALREAAAALAGLALAAAWVRRPVLAHALGDSGTVFRAGLAWGLLLFGALVFVQESAWLGHHLYFWLEDDAMVSMRYGARLAEGKGLTWTAGPRVEGYSDFLWTVGMALIHWLGAPRALASGWVLAANAACLAWLASAVRRLSRALGAGASAAALAGLACAFSYDCMAGALSGLEMVAVAAVMAEALAQGTGAGSKGRPWPWTAFALAGLLPLLRADGGLPAVLVLAWGLGASRPRGPRFLVLACALALGPGLAQEAFRHAYYGQWVPNTYTLKAGVWPGKYRDAFGQVARDLGRYPLVVLAAAAGLAVPRWRAPLAVVLVLALYCVWAGQDYYPFLRFFAPGWPLLFALGFAAADRAAGSGRRGALAGAVLALVSANAAWSLPVLVDSGWQGAQERVRVALKLRGLVRPGQTLAGAWAGAFFYFSRARGVDVLGKCDAVVARARPDPTLGGEGHNKLDLDHTLGELRPDWVLLKAPSYSPADRAYLVASYDQRVAAYPLFVKFCLPHMTRISDHWALCRCRWPRRGAKAREAPERATAPRSP